MPIGRIPCLELGMESFQVKDIDYVEDRQIPVEKLGKWTNEYWMSTAWASDVKDNSKPSAAFTENHCQYY